MSWGLHGCGIGGKDGGLAVHNSCLTITLTLPILICLAQGHFLNCSALRGRALAGLCWRTGCSPQQTAAKSHSDKQQLRNFEQDSNCEKSGLLWEEEPSMKRENRFETG